MKVLITGVSGFVGRQLATRLLDEGHSVVGVDLCTADLEFESYPEFQSIEANLMHPNVANQLPWDDIDQLYHLAAAGVKAATRQWSVCVQVNVIGTAHLVGALLNRDRNGLSVPRIVYTKSYYEDHLDTVLALRENAYVVSKIAATKWLEAIAPVYSKSICIVKVYQVYGPGDDPGNVISYAVLALRAGQVATFGSGSGRRDWIYIDDFIEGLISCSVAESALGCLYYDLGIGQKYTIKEMVLKVAEILKADRNLLVFDPLLDRGDCEIDDCASAFVPHWQPRYDIVNGLKLLIERI